MVTTGAGEIWFNEANNAVIGKYNPQTGAVTKYSKADGPFPGYEVTDIAFAPNGKLYILTYDASVAAGVQTGAPGGSMYEVTLSGSTYTATEILRFNPGDMPNSISFDAEGYAYIGSASGPQVYRWSPTTPPVVWHTFPSGNAAGDFIILDGYMYVLWQLRDDMLGYGHTRLYRVTLGPGNSYVSHVDLGSVSNTMGNAHGFGMARINSDLYVGSSNGLLYKVVQLSPSLSLAPIYNNNVMINGLTSRVEPLGDYAVPPSISSTPRMIACGVTGYRVDTVATRGVRPQGASLTWHTSIPVSDANAISIAPGGTVGPGTYYVALRNNTVNCYGPPAVVSIFADTECSEGNLSCSEISISPAPVAGVSSQSMLSVTIDVREPGTFPIRSLAGSGFTLANGTKSIDATQTGVQTFLVPVNYDGSALGTLNLNILNAGTCSLNLAATPKRKVVSDVWTLDNCTPQQVGPTLR
nr:hypothetical protein [uncultured Dyadobacter sp.]